MGENYENEMSLDKQGDENCKHDTLINIILDYIMALVQWLNSHSFELVFFLHLFTLEFDNVLVLDNFIGLMNSENELRYTLDYVKIEKVLTVLFIISQNHIEEKNACCNRDCGSDRIEPVKFT